jgi:phosphinothricin acetyltransferase
MPEAVTAASALQVRAALVDDAVQIAAIWNREVLETDHTTDTEPRTVAEQRAWLRARDAAHPVIVAVAESEILAYGALSIYRPKPAFHRTVEDSVYVKAGYRGRGLGATILRHLLELAHERDHHAIMARVTGANAASLALHERHGFVRVGVERATAFKHGRWLDVVVLQRLLD